MSTESKAFNRGTGLLVIEARHSNPNGDPDIESDPRTLEGDGRGLISPVSFKRKLRDLVEDKDAPVWTHAQQALGLNGQRGYDILEKRGRDRGTISKMDADTFNNAYWDGRVFGNTFLEDMKESKGKGESVEHFINTGVVQFGAGISVAPVEIARLTMTNKSGVQEGKDRGMAPMGWRVVQHAVYTMPFFVNPMMARKSTCDSQDIDILKFLIPLAYRSTASAVRPFVEVRHAWFAEHKTPLGSCPDSLILDTLTPKKSIGNPDTPSTTIDDYTVPNELPEEIRGRLESFEDLCLKQW